jgi:hypothetical protein
LLAAAAPWQPGRGDINLGSVRIGSGNVLFNSSQGQAGRLINGCSTGAARWCGILRAMAGFEVRLLPVKFSKAFSDYQAAWRSCCR